METPYNCVATLSGSLASTYRLAMLSPTKFASGNFSWQDSKVRVWENTSGDTFECVSELNSSAWSILALSENRFVVGSDNGGVIIFKEESKNNYVVDGQFWEHNDAVKALVLLSNVSFVSGSRDKTIIIWNYNQSTDKYEKGKVLDYHTGIVDKLMALHGNTIVSCSGDSSVGISQLNGDEIQTFHLKGDHDAYLDTLLLLPDGRFVTGGGQGLIVVWGSTTGDSNDYSSYKGTILPGHKGAICDLIAFSDGTIVSGSHDRTIRIWGINPDGSYECRNTIEADEFVFGLTLLNDNSFAARYNSSTLFIWTRTSDYNFTRTDLNGHMGAITSNILQLPDERIITGSEDRTIKVWNKN